MTLFPTAAAALALAATGLVAAAPADAQYYRHGGYGRHYGYRHGGYGYRHYGFRYRHYGYGFHHRGYGYRHRYYR